MGKRRKKGQDRISVFFEKGKEKEKLKGRGWQVKGMCLGQAFCRARGGEEPQEKKVTFNPRENGECQKGERVGGKKV